MPNKVKLIKQELEKRLSLLWDLIPEGEKVLQDDFTKDDANNLVKYTELESLLRFIDSLPEEHNEDLEEAANDLTKIYAGEGCVDPKREGFAFYVGFKNGAKWQKQQMMKDAADSKITTDGNSIFPIIKYQLPLTYDCKIGDKVKLIIIKEKQQ